MSHSFGYNRRDTEADTRPSSLWPKLHRCRVEKRQSLAQRGPRGVDAQIPSEQIARLKGFGAWIGANGEGIYGTRPWTSL